MFRMKWRQDVDNWSLCLWPCYTVLAFGSTRALWRGCQVTFGQPGKINIKPSFTWALQKKWATKRFSTYGVCVCVCMYVWALSTPYTYALILNIASQKLNTLTFWWPVVTALSNTSDPWTKSWLCLLTMLLMSSDRFYMVSQGLWGCCWWGYLWLAYQIGFYLFFVGRGGAHAPNWIWHRSDCFSWTVFKSWTPDAWTVRARGLGTFFIFALFSAI